MGVKSRRVIELTAKDFHAYVQKHVKGITSLYVDKQDILQEELIFKERWHNVSPIPQIQSCHHFRQHGKKILLVSKTSHSELVRINIYAGKVKQLGKRKRLHYSHIYSDS